MKVNQPAKSRCVMAKISYRFLVERAVQIQRVQSLLAWV